MPRANLFIQSQRQVSLNNVLLRSNLKLGGDNVLLVNDIAGNIEWFTGVATLLPLGWQGLRVFRNYKYNYVKDISALQRFFYDELSEVANVGAIVFTHGSPLLGHTSIPKLLNAVSASL